jgi:hypothetical protein
MASPLVKVLAFVEMTVILVYSAYLVWSAVTIFLGEPDVFVFLVGSVLITIGLLGLMSLVWRSAGNALYIGWGLHVAGAVILAPLFVEISPVPWDSPGGAVFYGAFNLLLPYVVFVIVRVPQRRGRALLLERPTEFQKAHRLSVGEALVLVLGCALAAVLVFVGGRFGQLLFAVYVIGPLVGVSILATLIRAIYRELRGKRDPIPLVQRRMKIRSSLRKPAQRRHYWTVMEDPLPNGDDEAAY